MIALWLLYTVTLGTLFAAAALGAERIARLKHWPVRGIWLTAVIASVLVPIVADLFAKPAIMQAGTTSSHAAASHLSFDVPLLILWGAASLLMLTRLITTTVTLYRRRQSWQDGVVDGTPVLLTAEIGPALMGLVHPRAVIPAWALSLDANQRALMLLHETEHARASDPWLLWLGVITTVLTPWNPALWWSVRRLRLAIEMDCDARVLRSGADVRTYASLLVAVGERASHTPFLWAAALVQPQSLLEQRIRAMTSPARVRRPLLAIATLGAATALVLLAACEAPMPDQALPGGSPAHAASTPQSEVADTIRLTAIENMVPTTAPQYKVGDKVPLTIMLKGVPIADPKVIQQIGNAAPGQDYKVQGEPVRNGVIVGQAAMVKGQKLMYYVADSIKVGHEEHPAQRP